MNAPTYLDLRIGARMRLAHLRGIATQVNTRAAPSKQQTWRDARRYGFGNWRAAYCALSQGFNGDGKNKIAIWYSHVGPEFRAERYAYECREASRSVRNNRGYFTREDYSALMRGIVGNLSHGRYISGYEDSDNGERVYFPSVHASEGEAADMADEHARIAGESAMEWDIRFNAAQALEGEIEEAQSRLCECFALRHKPKFAHLRAELLDLVQTIRDKREELARDFAGVL
jgi:hypothetical protein